LPRVTQRPAGENSDKLQKSNIGEFPTMPADLKPLDDLIADAHQWWRFHKARGQQIEALACRIRIKALCDARVALEPKENGK
jgi:hypothetical protein